MAGKSPGKRLEGARTAKGLSLAQAWSPVNVELGPLGCSIQQIRNYELDKVAEQDWNPLVIAVLASAYGTTTALLSEAAYRELERLRDQVLPALPCIAA